MDVGLILSVAQTLFTALQCSELKEICSILGYTAKLDDFQRTISTIRAVLHDAEEKQEQLSNEAQLWIEELKDAVYDADDLLDEFVTIAEQKQHLEASKKVIFFSRFNPFVVAYNMSRGLKMLRNKLDAAASNHSQFGFSVDYLPHRMRREETCSYVCAGNIIGRENDVENIVHMLLNYTNVQRDVSYYTIVGIGGLGKTTLAQLVYNDERVVRMFPLRLWTCVSDHNQKQLDIEVILGKILASITGHKEEGSTMDWVQIQLREKLANSRYLLVLDDVWTESRTQWLKLAEYLVDGQRGSWIVVTTRSQETARIIGDGLMYELEGLSEANSWCLFERMAFGSERSNSQDDLVKIGREIVVGCARVPLAIRMVGSLLYGQDKSKWLSFKEIGLAKSRESQNDIMPILKLSYHHLESPLKSCFSYCALFPKDFEIEKEMLISLWMAQGYLVPLDEGQSMEDTGEEYFAILLRRCFFQDIQQGKNGEIISCKIHDLLHDLAQKVAGKEICSMDSITSNVDKRVRHLTLLRSESAKCSFTNKTHLRSYLQVGMGYQATKMDKCSLEALLANCMCLRAMDLSNSNIKSLPDSVGALLHLRFLDLSRNVDLIVLPKSIIRLHNLETLKLCCCSRLKGLPKKFCKLVKLRVLDIEGCSDFTYMPRGIGKLECLHTLTQFVLGETSSNWKQWIDQLEDLKALRKLKDFLKIKVSVPKNAIKAKKIGRLEGGYLTNKEHLNKIHISFTNKDFEGEIDERAGYEEVLMEGLQPHSNLTAIEVSRYNGVRMPSWMMFLPNLVRIELLECGELLHLSCLGNLHHLKVIDLENLSNLEYIEDSTLASASTGLLRAESLSYFPSLERLRLYNLPKLKGWWRSGMWPGVEHHDQLLFGGSNMVQIPSLCLSQLKTLLIRRCPELISFLVCPKLEDLNLRDFNNGLRIIMRTLDDPSSSHGISKLMVMRIDNLAWLNSLPVEAFQSLTYMEINYDNEVEAFEEVKEVFQSCSASLQSLSIEHCPKLNNIFGGLEQLTALEMLYIARCPNLRISEEKEDDTGMPWRTLQHKLRSLQLRDLPKLVHLPEGIQYLTALQSLQISCCKSLESLPNWMFKLTSLNRLDVHVCSARLRERCQNPNGEDWPNIQHIPSIILL